MVRSLFKNERINVFKKSKTIQKLTLKNLVRFNLFAQSHLDEAVFYFGGMGEVGVKLTKKLLTPN
jgi:hypothetical protein